MALNAQQINRFRTRAKAAGYTDDDIAKEIARKQAEVQATAAPAAPAAGIDIGSVGAEAPAPTKPSLAARIGTGAIDFVKGMFEPAKNLGEAVGESLQMPGEVADLQKRQQNALATSERLIQSAKRLEAEGKKDEAKKMLLLAQRAAGQTTPEAIALEDRANKGIKKTIKGGVGTAAFMVPGGASPATRVLAGAATGAATGFAHSQEGEEVGATVGGGVLGGAISGAGELVGGLVRKRAAAAAAKAAAAKPGDINELAAKSYSRIFQIPKNRQYAGLDPVKTSKALMGYDVKPSSLDDLVTISDKVTGENGILKQSVDDALAQAKDTVNISDAVVAAKRSVKGKLQAKEAKELLQLIRDAMPENTNIDAAHPLDVLQTERFLSENASTYWNAWQRTGAPKEKAYYEAFRAATEVLKNRLDTSSAAVINTIKTPERITELAKVSPKLAQEFLDATSVRQLRSLQKPFVDTMRLVQATNDQSGRILQQTAERSVSGMVGAGAGAAVAGAPGAVVGNVVGQAFAPLEQAAVKSIQVPAVTRIAGMIDAASKLGLKGDAFAKMANNVWGKVGGDAVRNLMVTQGVKAATKTKDAEPFPGALPMGGEVAGAAMPGGAPGAADIAPGEAEVLQTDTVTGHSVKDHMTAYSKALAAGDKKAASYIKQQLDVEQEYQKSQGKAKVSANMQKELMKLDVADVIYTNVVNSISAVGPTGRIAGKVQEGAAAVGFNAKATAYEALRSSSIAPLARILSGESGVLNEGDIKRAEKLLPKITDTPQEVQLKLTQLKTIIDARRGKLQTAPDATPEFTTGAAF